MANEPEDRAFHPQSSSGTCRNSRGNGGGSCADYPTHAKPSRSQSVQPAPQQQHREENIRQALVVEVLRRRAFNNHLLDDGGAALASASRSASSKVQSRASLPNAAQAVREASAIDAAAAAGRHLDAAAISGGRLDQLNQLPPGGGFQEDVARRSPPQLPQLPQQIPSQSPSQLPLQPAQESSTPLLLTRHHAAAALAQTSALTEGWTSKAPSLSSRLPFPSPVPNVTATAITVDISAPAAVPSDSGATAAAASDASRVSPLTPRARFSGIFYSPASPPEQTTTTSHFNESTAPFSLSGRTPRFSGSLTRSQNRLPAAHQGDPGPSSLLRSPRSSPDAASASLSHSSHPLLSPTSSLSTTSTTLPAVIGAALSPAPYLRAIAAEIPLDLPRDLSPDLPPPPGLPHDLPPDLPSTGSAGRPTAVGTPVAEAGGNAVEGWSEAEEREAVRRLCAEEVAQLKALLLDDADRDDDGSGGNRIAPLGQRAEHAGLSEQRAKHDGSRSDVSRSNGGPHVPLPAGLFSGATTTVQENTDLKSTQPATPHQQQQREGPSQQNDPYRLYLLAEIRKTRAAMLSRGATTAPLGHLQQEHARSPADLTANFNHPGAAVPEKSKVSTARDVPRFHMGGRGGGARGAMVLSAMLTPLGIVALAPRARANAAARLPGSPFGNVGVTEQVAAREATEVARGATEVAREVTKAAREAEEQELRDICSMLFSAGAREADGFLQGALGGAGEKGVVGGSSGWEVSGSRLGDTTLPHQHATLQLGLPQHTILQQATPQHAAPQHATPHHTALQHATPQQTLIHDQLPMQRTMITQQEPMPLQHVLAAAAAQAAAVEPPQEATLTPQEMMLLRDVLAAPAQDHEAARWITTKSPLDAQPSMVGTDSPRGDFKQPQRRTPKPDAQRTSGMAGERDLSTGNTWGAERGAVHHTVAQLGAVVAGSSDYGLAATAAAAAAAAAGAQLSFSRYSSSSRSSSRGGGGAGSGATRATSRRPRTTAVGASGPTVTAVGVSSVGAACIGASGVNTAALLPSMRPAAEASLPVPTAVDRSSVESSPVLVPVPAVSFMLDEQNPRFHRPDSSQGFGRDWGISDAGGWSLWAGNQPVWKAGNANAVCVDGFPGFSPQPAAQPWDGLRCLVCGSELSEENTTAVRVLPDHVGPQGLGLKIGLRVHGCNDCLGLLVPLYLQSLERKKARESVAVAGSRGVQGSGNETGGDANDAVAAVGETLEDLHKSVGAGVVVAQKEAEQVGNGGSLQEEDVRIRGDVRPSRLVNVSEIGDECQIAPRRADSLPSKCDVHRIRKVPRGVGRCETAQLCLSSSPTSGLRRSRESPEALSSHDTEVAAEADSKRKRTQ
ncbi:unnamed protein product [Closterium sp. NIES-53]